MFIRFVFKPLHFRPEVASDCFGQLFCSYILIYTHRLVHVADRLLLSNYISTVADVRLTLAPASGGLRLCGRGAAKLVEK